MYLFHTSQGVKILIENFALLHRILKFPQNKNSSKIKGSNLEYEIQFCHQYFSVEGKKIDCLSSWTSETNHLTQLVVRDFLISLQIVYLLLYLSCQWLHSLLFYVSPPIIVAYFSSQQVNDKLLELLGGLQFGFRPWMHLCGFMTKFQMWGLPYTTVGNCVLVFQIIYGLPKGRQFQSMSMCQSVEMICSITLLWEARSSMLLFAKGSVEEIIKLGSDKSSSSLELVFKISPNHSLSFKIKINSCFYISFEALVCEKAHVCLNLILEGFLKLHQICLACWCLSALNT